MKEVIEFLKEYELLCKKYHMGFGGCGCCGSSYLIYGDYKYINSIHYNYNLNEIFVGDDGYRHERPDLYTEEEIKEEKKLNEYLEDIDNEGNKEK